jgi:glycosyltransferase involved in cell wall biosynthesis
MKKISVIIPVHNEESRLANCLEQVIPFLSTHYQGRHEVIIVDNGSTDDTLKIAKAYVNSYDNVSAYSIPLRGKGIAIKKGMLYAEGLYRYMCDVDLSTPISALPEFLTMGVLFDVVIGSRELKPAQVQTTAMRRAVGRAFHLLVNDLVPGVLDTQCGFKLFRDTAARAIFGALQLPGMAFDVEALYLARLMGFSVGEIPVQWEHNPDSRVRLLWDSLEMARDVISIPWIHATKQIPA